MCCNVNHYVDDNATDINTLVTPNFALKIQMKKAVMNTFYTHISFLSCMTLAPHWFC